MNMMILLFASCVSAKKQRKSIVRNDASPEVGNNENQGVPGEVPLPDLIESVGIVLVSVNDDSNNLIQDRGEDDNNGPENDEAD